MFISLLSILTHPTAHYILSNIYYTFHFSHTAHIRTQSFHSLQCIIQFWRGCCKGFFTETRPWIDMQSPPSKWIPFPLFSAVCTIYLTHTGWLLSLWWWCDALCVQVVEDGYLFFAQRKLVTLFSAPNYCGEFDNAGAVMNVDKSLLCYFTILQPGDKNESYYWKKKKKRNKEKRERERIEVRGIVFWWMGQCGLSCCCNNNSWSGSF